MRYRAVYNKHGEKTREYIDGELVYSDDSEPQKNQAPMVMGDIQPYISQIDGRIIGSRSKHRQHLREHGCIEVGNERMQAKTLQPAPGLKQDIIRAYEQVTTRRK